jgi:hypothetical protein
MNELRKLEFGVIAQDKITGFTGMVTAKTSYITGCDRYYLTPRVDKDGKCPEGKYFDEGTLEVVGEGIYQKDLQVQPQTETVKERTISELVAEADSVEEAEKGFLAKFKANFAKGEAESDRLRLKKSNECYMDRLMRENRNNKRLDPPSFRGGPHDEDATVSNGGIK